MHWPILHKTPHKYSDDTILFDLNRYREEIHSIVKKSQTSVFILDSNSLLEKTRMVDLEMKKVFKKYQIAYSFKTNYEVAKSKLLFKIADAEVVSSSEYTLARRLGFTKGRIIFNGPYKTEQDLKRAIEDGALVHLDTHSQIDSVMELKRSVWPLKSIRVGLRINFNRKAQLDSRFGFNADLNAIFALILKLEKTGIRVVSLHHHGGSDIYDPNARFSAAKQIAQLVIQLKKRGIFIKSLDLGGGFPAGGMLPLYMQKNKFRTLTTSFKTHILAIKQGLIEGGLRESAIKTLKIIIEPGRLLVDEAVIWVVKVVDQSIQNHRQVLVVNGAITQLPLTYYRSQIVKAFNRNFEPKTEKGISTVVYGATCREDDILFNEFLPEAHDGDYLVFYVVGAYNQSMGSAFIIDESKFKIVGTKTNRD